MARWMSWSLVVVALGLTGCSAMEQYRFPTTQDKIPTKVIIAFSENYPNDATMKSFTEQQMFDGTKRYSIVVVNAKFAEHTVTFTQDGTEVKSPL